ISITFDLLTYLLIGGIGTLTGPIVGTLIIVWLSQKLQFLQDYRMLIFGPVLTLLVIFYPRGIVGAIANWKFKRQNRYLKLGNSGGKSPVIGSESLAEKQVKEG
ncbi:MAG: branched-chain amino acid ABC transporter permease, partial [Neobacillus sp.]